MNKKLIEANLKLVEPIAKSECSKVKGDRDFLEDLISAGYSGLIEASEKFNEDMGFKFENLANTLIKLRVKDRITKEYRQKGGFTDYQARKIGEYRKVEEQLSQEFLRTPTLREISNVMKLSIKEVDRIREISLSPISLQIPIGENEENVLSDIIEDKETLSPKQKVLEEEIETVPQKSWRFNLKDYIWDRNKMVGVSGRIIAKELNRSPSKIYRIIREMTLENFCRYLQFLGRKVERTKKLLRVSYLVSDIGVVDIYRIKR